MAVFKVTHLLFCSRLGYLLRSLFNVFCNPYFFGKWLLLICSFSVLGTKTVSQVIEWPKFLIQFITQNDPLPLFPDISDARIIFWNIRKLITREAACIFMKPIKNILKTLDCSTPENLSVFSEVRQNDFRQWIFTISHT